MESNIPVEMRNLNNWVLWRKETREGKLTKIPYSANGLMAKSNDATTWTTFDYVIKFKDNFDGIGFMAGIEPSGIILVDLDHSMEDGEPMPWARKIIELANSYTEISPSGNGYHIFFRGKIPGPSKKCLDAEIYDRTRYFTVTGNVDPVYVSKFRELSDNESAEIYNIIMARNGTKEKPIEKKQIINIRPDILTKMFSAKNGIAIQSLYYGDTSACSGDQSAADCALCCHLAFWTNKDYSQIDALFRSSNLMRDKWNKKHSGDGRTYGEMTINRAINNCSTTIGDNTQRVEQVEHTIDGKNLEEIRAKTVSITKASDYLDKVEKLGDFMELEKESFNDS